MGLKFNQKLNRNGQIIVTSLAALMVASAFLFQNCAAPPVDETAVGSTGPDPGNSLYRLPAAFNETLNTGVTCSVTVSTTNVPVGGQLGYTFATTGTIPAGYRIYAYGSRQGVADASLIMPEFFTAMSQVVTNDGTQGGSYIRYFQIRDSLGRALCQTNAVSFTYQGNICMVSISSTSVRQGNAVAFTTTYVSPQTTAPTGATAQFLGWNNGLVIAPLPYDSTNLAYYARTMNAVDVGSEYIRRIAVNNADGTPYCVTNNVRFRVTQ